MTSTVPLKTGTYLDRILAQTLKDLAVRKALIGTEALREKAALQPDPINFEATLTRDTVTVIAEFKRASPSKGIFPVSIAPAEIAAE